MRLSTKLGASLSTVALGAAAALGGAGVAQAQSLGSLGSSAEAPDLVLTISEANEAGALGTLTNNTERDLTCYVGVGDATTLAENEDGLADAEDQEAYLRDLYADLADDPTFNFDTTGEVAAGETAEWSVELTADADYAAGALAFCDPLGDPLYAIDYESTGTGSLDMGSLGS